VYGQYLFCEPARINSLFRSVILEHKARLKELVGQATPHPGLHQRSVIVRYGEVRRPVRVACHAHLPVQLEVAQTGYVVHGLVSGD
jgi:hypothetical protein